MTMRVRTSALCSALLLALTTGCNHQPNGVGVGQGGPGTGDGQGDGGTIGIGDTAGDAGSSGQNGNGDGGTTGQNGDGGSGTCQDTSNLEGCSCSNGDMPRACFTGPAANRNLYLCHDGMQTCTLSGEFSTWGPCTGSVTVCGDCSPNTVEACYDGDPSTRGVGVCADGVHYCDATGHFGPCLFETTPGTAEVCGDGKDNDCNGKVDCDDSTCNCSCKPGTSQSCYTGPTGTENVGLCKGGTQACSTLGQWGPCSGEVLPSATEQCWMSIDANCNGMMGCQDAACGCVCTPGAMQNCYGGPAGTEGVGPCHGGMQQCNSMGQWGMCTGQVLPVPETTTQCMSGTDSNCNGEVGCDDAACGCVCAPGATQACYTGPAGTDNVGPCHGGTQPCTMYGQWGSCTGEVLPATEQCTDTIDNSCDGKIDCADSACQACCNATDQVLPLPTADLLFVVDRSSSMTEAVSPTMSRWDALSAAADAVLPGLDSSFYMGLLMFNDDSIFQSNVCDVPSTPDVKLAQPSATLISNDIANTYPSGDTPTYQALKVAKTYYAGISATRPRFIALMTDGDPNCFYNTGDVVGILGQLHTSGIDTFVIGIPGDDSDLVSNLNQMATAGGRPLAGATKFYSATSSVNFVTSLQGVALATAGCTFALPSTPSNPNNVTVKFDGTVVPSDATNGWQYQSTSKIHFNGTSCTQINSGSVKKITVREGC